MSLEDRLADALPEDVRSRVYHISTPPTASIPLFAAGPGQEDQPTVCETHFCGISSPGEGNEDGVLVFAIEVVIFNTRSLTTVFISKADSSGFTSRLHSPTGSLSIPQTVTQIFLDYLIKPRLNEKRLVLSLFARSQNQYLFPGSIENAEKHVLDDRRLIKWWCRVLDSIWRPYDIRQSNASRNRSYTVTAHVVVPGCDSSETRAFFPTSHLYDLASPKWIHGYPMRQLSLNTTLPLRCLIPRLPDDPKSRFLDDLDGTYIGPDGEWRSVKTMEQFWELMSYRQECAAGRLVGFIWAVFSHRSVGKGQGQQDQHAPMSFSSGTSDAGPLLTPAHSQRPTFEEAHNVGPTVDNLTPLPQTASPPPSSPVLEPHDSKSNSSGAADHTTDGTDVTPISVKHLNATGTKEGSSLATPTFKTSITPGQVIILAVDYEILMAELLEMDFAGSQLATESTRNWLAQVAAKAEVSRFGVNVVGKKKHNVVRNGAPNIRTQVNTLTCVKKKRKVDEAGVAATPPESVSAPPPHILSSNLIRKKPKLSNAG